MSEWKPESVADWLKRHVRRTDEDESALGPALVLAVDDTPYAPSAWIKYQAAAGSYPSYRSVDLSDLEDIETRESGPRWGTGGPEADMISKFGVDWRSRSVTPPSSGGDG